MEKTVVKHFDVAVIGGGPAGLMAAGRAGELGKKVVLLEKNERLGQKLLLTGKGRCNLTNAEFDLRKLVEHYGKKGRFLFHAFSLFGPKEVIAFFESFGLKTKTERGQRVFPASDKALDVLKALVAYLVKNKVTIICNAKVVKVIGRGRQIQKLVLKNEEISADSYIFCSGGKAYPGTGSTGDGFAWARDLGHKIEELSPVLVPLKIREGWVKELQGLSLKNVEIKITQKGSRVTGRFGECLFTHFGLSGPIVLDLSGEIGKLLKAGQVKISLDLKPALDFQILDKRIQRDFAKYANKTFKNGLKDLLPVRLIPLIIKTSGIDPEKKINSITREERSGLAKLLKNLEMTVVGLLDFDQAIATAGGISLAEIDDKTMKSKLVDNLFFAGEIIDLDGPTGGFNLQLCWSTGRLAGENA